MKNPHVLPILSLVILMNGCVKLAEEPLTYEVVGIRNLSDVAMAMTPVAPEKNLSGKRLIIGEKLTWIDGQIFEDWERSDVSQPPMGFNDPILADVYWQRSGAAGCVITRAIG